MKRGIFAASLAALLVFTAIAIIADNPMLGKCAMFLGCGLGLYGVAEVSIDHRGSYIGDPPELH